MATVNAKKIKKPARYTSMGMTTSSFKPGWETQELTKEEYVMYVKDQRNMRVVSNDAHIGQTNNGFARKPCGGFYYH